jgi:hypothetical protein
VESQPAARRESSLGFLSLCIPAKRVMQLTGALFAKQSMKLFAINTGYQLVCYLVMGTVPTIWQ